MINVVAFIISTTFLWCSYTFLWPWLGPQVFEPVPLFTAKGALLMAAWHAFWSLLGQWARDQRYVRKDMP